MSTTTEPVAQLEKKRKAGVEFSGTATGKLDEGAIPSDSYKSHYLYPADTKSDSSYPVVSAEGRLMRGNVSSAWELGARGGVDESTHKKKLRKLGKEFDSNPLPDDAYENARRLEKRVEIEKLDSDRHLAVGVAMEPDRVDTQGDYETAETIRTLSDGYMERLAVGDAENGVMHASFPDGETLTHVENRVLSEPEQIGETEYAAGTWVVGKRIKDDALWELVDSGTLTGFSIGGHIHDAELLDVNDVPESVHVPEDIKEMAEAADEPLREITDATIHEISLVDYPAVPRAQIQVAKADDDGELLKAAPELTDGVETATDFLVERGHEESAARDLATFLNREKTSASDVSESRESTGWLARAKRFFNRREGGASGETDTNGIESDEAAEPVRDAVTIEDMTTEFTSDEQDALKSFIQTELMDDSNEESDTDSGTDTKAIESLTEQLDAIETKLDEQADDEDAEKSDDSEDDEMVERLAANQEQMADLLKQMASAQGVSQQADIDPSEQADEPSQKAQFFGLAGVSGGER